MNEFTEFIENLFGAKITVCQTQEKFTDLHRDGEVEKELRSLSSLFKKQNHDKLADQIESMFKLAKIKGSAEAMKEVATILEAKTDLSPGEFSCNLHYYLENFTHLKNYFLVIIYVYFTWVFAGQNFNSEFVCNENNGVCFTIFA